MATNKLSRLVSLLIFLVYLVMLMQIAGFVMVFATGQELGLKIDGQIWLQEISEMALSDQLFIALILFLPTATFLWAIFQIERICRQFWKGNIFALVNVLRFKRFALALLALGAMEMTVNPALIIYLWGRDLIPNWPDIDAAFILDTLEAEIIMVGVLFFVIARIMETGLAMKDEMELTV